MRRRRQCFRRRPRECPRPTALECEHNCRDTWAACKRCSRPPLCIGQNQDRVTFEWKALSFSFVRPLQPYRGVQVARNATKKMRGQFSTLWDLYFILRNVEGKARTCTFVYIPLLNFSPRLLQLEDNAPSFSAPSSLLSLWPSYSSLTNSHPPPLSLMPPPPLPSLFLSKHFFLRVFSLIAVPLSLSYQL